MRNVQSKLVFDPGTAPQSPKATNVVVVLLGLVVIMRFSKY